MSRHEEKDIEARLQKRCSEELVRLMRRLIQLRYERYKEALVGTDQSWTRGRAQEARDLQKIFSPPELTPEE